jgi:hypothetical protein
MKKYFIVGTFIIMIIAACQKSIDNADEANRPASVEDSVILKGDTLSYEVITNDPEGWYGMWNEPDGSTNCNPLDSISFGSPEYYSSGWKHSFVCPDKPFQAFISVATKLYDKDITVNLYKNNELIKTSTDDSGLGLGVAKLLVTSETGTLTGTAADPVLTYEVLIDEQDTTKFESDGWTGQWNMPDGKVSSLEKPLLTNFAICSGWKHTFKPEHLPFTMYLGGSPYTPDGARITINFYVNGVLVKSQSSRNYIYENKYEVP